MGLRDWFKLLDEEPLSLEDVQKGNTMNDEISKPVVQPVPVEAPKAEPTKEEPKHNNGVSPVEKQG